MTPAGAETTLWLAYNQFGSDETQCSAGFTHVEERHEVHRLVKEKMRRAGQLYALGSPFRSAEPSSAQNP